MPGEGAFIRTLMSVMGLEQHFAYNNNILHYKSNDELIGNV